MEMLTVPPSVASSIIKYACALADEWQNPHQRGYRCDGHPADILVAAGLMVEDPIIEGRYLATMKGLSYAGYTLADLPDIRGVKCTCGPYDNRCPSCLHACEECRGAGKKWINITISGHEVPTFDTIPCLSCDESGWCPFYEDYDKTLIMAWKAKHGQGQSP